MAEAQATCFRECGELLSGSIVLTDFAKGPAFQYLYNAED